MEPAVQEAWDRWLRGRDPAARETLVLQYAPLVKYVIGRLAISLPAVMDHEDVLSFGTLGLLQALDRYQADRGVKFENFAILRVRGAILDALRSTDRLPRSVRQKARLLQDAAVRLHDRLGHHPTDAELAAELGITEQQVVLLMQEASWVTVSLDSLVDRPGPEGDGAYGLSIAGNEDVLAQVERKELLARLSNAVSELPDREQLIVALYYQEELTMREIGEVLGVSEVRVCQLHARALHRLRVSLALESRHALGARRVA